MVIGIISDTHNLLRPDVLAALQGCDRILHAGDIAKPEILTTLEAIAPLTVVRGNADKDWAQALPLTESFELAGLRFFMTHKKKDIPAGIEADVVIFGHSHRYEETRHGETLFLNPGSCGPRRFTQPITMMIMEIKDGQVEVRKLTFAHGEKQTKAPAGDLRDMVEGIVRDVNKGRTVQEIAGKYRISEDLADQICRLYLTHPGIDAEGLIMKMELYQAGK